jgi:hypothetical protein
MLTLVAAYFLLRSVREPSRPALWSAVLGSAAAAAAVGARPHLFVLAPFVVATGVVVYRRAASGRARWRGLAALAVPYLAIGMVLAVYNAARFGSAGEFGTTYQLAGMNMPKYPAYRLSYLGPNVVDYLFSWPRFGLDWPFVRLRPNTFVGNPAVHSNEPVAGVVVLSPLIAFGLACAIATRSWASRHLRPVLALAALAVAASFLSLVALSLPFNASTMRYSVDFAPLLVVAATIVCAATYRVVGRARWRTLFVASWATIVVFGALVGIALVQTPCPGTGSC